MGITKIMGFVGGHHLDLKLSYDHENRLVHVKGISSNNRYLVDIEFDYKEKNVIQIKGFRGGKGVDLKLEGSCNNSPENLVTLALNLE
ncbi:MAG: hypothetical protein ABIH59_00340 [archaeon]